MKAYLKLALIASVLALLTACGSRGAPLPPSLELPRPPADLTVSRKAGKITLSWTAPMRTTDGQNVRFKRLGPTLICRGVNEFPMIKCLQIIGQIAPVAPPVPPVVAKGEKKPPPPPKAEYTDKLPDDLQQMYPMGFATYAVQVMNWHWRAAGLSNQIRVPLAPTLPAPKQVRAEATAEGIVLNFDCPGPTTARPELTYVCRVFRREPDTNVRIVVQDVAWNGPVCATPAGENQRRCRATDRAFEWEETYEYWVAPITVVSQEGKKIAEVEGEDSPRTTIFAHDIFPPAVPSGLAAVASGVGQKPFVDLTWAPVSDTDLAGYNVYRREQGAPGWVKLTPQLVTVPAFRDEKVEPGHKYLYSVSAVDARNNESVRSQTAEEQVP